ncbi:H-2 class II histocompatibility antigen, A-R alpha chain-like [Centropristis striata]|uniref:H-2 class II histocompatibility antigen, A-R alpha chain-like n=1 Tax=Centropristis striata TaxID=184440 RepID=UPI0027E1DD1B|nr:H-2 class II histocompatibility antigen, A-R alpha chain-like [Centropristis striata]
MSVSVIVVIFVFTGAVCTSATTPPHDFHYTTGCYESGLVLVDGLLDDQVAGYADYSRKEVVVVIPHVPPVLGGLVEVAYQFAKNSISECRNTLRILKGRSPHAVIPQDAPHVSVHSRYEGEDGVLNTLFCLADHFYPPSINFTWTKNGVEVTEGVSNQRYRHNSDGTFHRISTLSFTPQDGDVYSCWVQHQASQRPLSRSWELQQQQHSNMSLAAGFFYTSLVLCLLGIGTGVFFFTKQPN